MKKNEKNKNKKIKKGRESITKDILTAYLNS
jgi:hypothetical protein